MSKQLSQQVDRLIHKILLKSENHHELLLGHCQSQLKLTNTQEHILMLLAQDDHLTNSDLARELNVSQPAVTKAVKALVQQGMLETIKDSHDGRVTYFVLTQEAMPIAEEHKHHHERTLAAYNQVVEAFSSEEQAIIATFLDKLSSGLDGD